MEEKIIPMNQVHGPYKIECALNAIYMCKYIIVCIQEGPL